MSDQQLKAFLKLAKDKNISIWFKMETCNPRQTLKANFYKFGKVSLWLNDQKVYGM